MNGCIKCSDFGNCDVCGVGYYSLIDENDGYKLCKECDKSCMTCSSSGSNKCSSCHKGFFLGTDGTCKKCENDCEYCIGSKVSDC